MPSLSWSKLVEEADVAEDKVLDPGDYELVLKSVKYKLTKNGDPMFACRYVVENGPHKNTTVWDNITLISDPNKKVGLQINMRKLYNLGADIKFLQTEPTEAEIIKKIEGSRIVATLEIDTSWGDTERNQIKTFKVNKEAVSAQRPAAAPAARTQTPSEEYAATSGEGADQADVDEAQADEAPKTTTKRRGSIPLPPAP